MIGAILAGGYGKRLKPITDEVPKALVQISENYTILDRQIFDFQNMGVKEIYILSGYLGDKIEERYGEEKYGIRFHYLRESKPLGTLFSVKNLLSERSDEDVVLRNGDTVTDLNFKRFVQFAQESPYSLTMFVIKMRSPFGIVDMLGDQVTEFQEKPLLNHFINAGIYYIKKSAFEAFQSDYVDKEIETTVFPRLAKKKLTGAYTEETFWMGIDSEKDLEQVRKEYSNREDFSWGYIKKLYEGNGRKFQEYFIKAGDRVSIDPGSNSIVRIISGRGMYSSEEQHKYLSQDVIQLKSDTKFVPIENTHLEIISM